MPFTGVNVKLMPLQVTAVIPLILAVGLTVTVNVNVVPLQLPDKGVII